MWLVVTIVHSYQLSITTVKMTSILDVVAGLDLPPYVDTIIRSNFQKF